MTDILIPRNVLRSFCQILFVWRLFMFKVYLQHQTKSAHCKQAGAKKYLYSQTRNNHRHHKDHAVYEKLNFMMSFCLFRCSFKTILPFLFFYTKTWSDFRFPDFPLIPIILQWIYFYVPIVYTVSLKESLVTGTENSTRNCSNKILSLLWFFSLFGSHLNSPCGCWR